MHLTFTHLNQKNVQHHATDSDCMGFCKCLCIALSEWFKHVSSGGNVKKDVHEDVQGVCLKRGGLRALGPLLCYCIPQRPLWLSEAAANRSHMATFIEGSLSPHHHHFLSVFYTVTHICSEKSSTSHIFFFNLFFFSSFLTPLISFCMLQYGPVYYTFNEINETRKEPTRQITYR